jgi:hypothetical protein
MRRMDREPEMSSAELLVEAWLAEQLLFTSLSDSPYGQTSLPSLEQQTASERLAALRTVLNRRPTLAGATRRLSVYEQLTLTVELLGDTVSPVRKTEGSTVPRILPLCDTARRAVRASQSIALCPARTRGRGRPRSGR